MRSKDKIIKNIEFVRDVFEKQINQRVGLNAVDVMMLDTHICIAELLAHKTIEADTNKTREGK